jgi:hypothetical protein
LQAFVLGLAARSRKRSTYSQNSNSVTVDQAARLGLLVQREDGTFSDPADTGRPQADYRQSSDENEELPEIGAMPGEPLEVDMETAETIADSSRIVEAQGVNLTGLVAEALSHSDRLPKMLQDLAEQNGNDLGAVHTEYQKAGAEVDRVIGRCSTAMTAA